jgi:hypothetical protein
MMPRCFNISLLLVSCMTGGTLRAATTPHGGPASETNITWTNEDLERLARVPGLISVIGLPPSEAERNVSEPAVRIRTEAPSRYAAQAVALNSRLEAEQAELHAFLKALDNARELRTETAGINLTGNDIGITPDASIDILQNRIRETQRQLDALEDLAHHRGIPPGILRGQRQGPDSTRHRVD